MRHETLTLIQDSLTEDEPLTVSALVEATGASRATVYSALTILKAERHHVGKNTFAYTKGTQEEPVEVEKPGAIEGLTWKEYTQHALDYVGRVHLQGEPSADSYETGFKQIAETFALIAAHVSEVKHRPDWRIVLGLDTDMENIT